MAVWCHCTDSFCIGIPSNKPGHCPGGQPANGSCWKRKVSWTLKQSSFPYCVVLNVLLHQAGQPGQCIGSFKMSSWSIPGGFMILLHLSQYQTCVSKITFIHILIFLRFHCGDLASFWAVSETLKWFHYSSITMALEKWLCQHLTIIN